MYEVIIFYKKKKFILRCSYKLIPFKLENFWPSLTSIKKLYFPYQTLSNWNPNAKCSEYTQIPLTYYNNTLDSYLEIYAKNDVSILKEGLLNFYKTLLDLKIDFNLKSFTCGSIALNFYIKKYNQINLNLPEKFTNILKNAYYGGRCEVFGNPKDDEKILHFDFKGMYQQCMLESLPYGDFIYKESNLNINEPGFYYINIEYYDNIPILPIKNTKLLFKNGKISGWYWHEEIILAVNHLKINNFQILYGLVSQQNDKILYNFINELNQIREQGFLKKQIGKLLINSFYGRLGLTSDLTFLTLQTSLNNEIDYGVIDNYFLIKKKISKKTKANIALAATITSKARIKLYEAFLEVSKSGGRVIYCDTDSIFTCFKKTAEVENKLLGKHVYFDTTKIDTIIKDAVFINPKTYGLILNNDQEVIKIKGVNNNLCNFTTLKENFYNKNQYLNLKSSITFKKNLNLEYVIKNKTIKIQEYNKRLWSDNLKTTTPLTI